MKKGGYALEWLLIFTILIGDNTNPVRDATIGSKQYNKQIFVVASMVVNTHNQRT